MNENNQLSLYDECLVLIKDTTKGDLYWTDNVQLIEPKVYTHIISVLMAGTGVHWEMEGFM